MHRIDGLGATVDNKFTEGDPVGGVQATVVTDDWLNDVQEELLSVLAAAAITPIKGTQNQLLTALRSSALFQTAAQFESSKRVATTEFVKRMGLEWSGFNSVSASTVLGNGSVGGIVSVAAAAAVNITLPPTAPVSQGGAILVLCAGDGAATLLSSAGDILTNAAGITVSIVLGRGDSALLVKVTGEWRLVGGSVALKYAAAFASGTGVTGYMKHPGGQIIQRGEGTTSGGIAAVTFPIAFPTACRQVIACERGATSWTTINFTVYGATGKSNTGVTIKSLTWNGSSFAGSTGSFDYIAIGE